MVKQQKLQIRNSTAEFLVFSRQAGENTIEVRVEDETVWLTQKLLSALFEVDVRTINEHLGNIYQNGEQLREATIRKFRTVQREGTREVAREIEHYNLNAIIAVGFRVNSKRATQFRQWAIGILRDFAIHGQTAAELIVQRAGYNKERMGLLPGRMPRTAEEKITESHA